MPYGPIYKGGPVEDAKMEDCVRDLKRKGHDEASAVAICKASLSRAHIVATTVRKGKAK